MKAALVTSVVLLCLCGISSADVVGPLTTSTPIASTLTDWTGSLAFAKFNPALGTLTSIDLYLSSSMSTVLTVKNNAGSSSSGHANTHLQVSVVDAGGHLIAPQIDMLGPSFNYNLAAGQQITSGTLTKSANNGTETFTDAATLSEFIGAGNIILSASTFTETALFNTGGNTDASQMTNASLTGTVTYTYTPVPEPVTMSLLGLGSLGVLLKRRRQA